MVIYRHNFEMENETATLHAVAQAAHLINNSVLLFNINLSFWSFENNISQPSIDFPPQKSNENLLIFIWIDWFTDLNFLNIAREFLR